MDRPQATVEGQLLWVNHTLNSPDRPSVQSAKTREPRRGRRGKTPAAWSFVFVVLRERAGERSESASQTHTYIYGTSVLTVCVYVENGGGGESSRCQLQTHFKQKPCADEGCCSWGGVVRGHHHQGTSWVTHTRVL